MGPPRNWNALAGVLLGATGVAIYFALILTFDPTLHGLLRTPVLNLAVLATGIGSSLIGVLQWWRGTRRGRLLPPLLAGVNVAFGAVFCWYLFVYSYQMPVSARAPAVSSIAPDFVLPDERGNDVRLSALRGQAVVLIFYRGHW